MTTPWNIKIALLFLSVVIAAAVPVGTIVAHGPHARVEEVFSGPLGPYVVTVQAIPFAGSFHITVQLTQRLNDIPSGDATVQVTGTGPLQESDERERIVEKLSLTGTNSYSSVLPVESEGEWQFEIEVNSPLGEAVVNVSSVVHGAPGVDWSVVGIGIVLMALVTIFASKAIAEKIHSRRHSIERNK